jgi:hypothetical protein
VETLLLATILFLVLQRSYKPDKKPLTERVRAPAPARRPGLWGSSGALSTPVCVCMSAAVPHLAQEIDTLCAEWRPDPLVPALTEAQLALSPPVLAG